MDIFGENRIKALEDLARRSVDEINALKTELAKEQHRRVSVEDALVDGLTIGIVSQTIGQKPVQPGNYDDMASRVNAARYVASLAGLPSSEFAELAVLYQTGMNSNPMDARRTAQNDILITDALHKRCGIYRI